MPKLKGFNQMIFDREQLTQIVEDWIQQKLNIWNEVDFVTYNKKNHQLTVYFKEATKV